MKKVSKLLMIDQDDKYLIMYRSDHPTFGGDPDLPGGTHEDGETILETMVREVEEESGVLVDGENAELIYSGTDFSKNGTQYTLYVERLKARPEIVISWEHSSYEWISRDEFIEKVKDTKDSFMKMVYSTLQK